MPGKKCLCTGCGQMRVAKARLRVKKVKPKNGRKGSRKARSRSRSVSPSRRMQLQRSGTMGYNDTMQGATQAYVQRVKNTFAHRPEVYREFMSILSQVQERDSNKIDIINRAILLLDGYPDLILSFNAFLPDEYTIEIQEDIVLIKEYASMPDMGEDEEVIEEWEYLNQSHDAGDPPMLQGTLHSSLQSTARSRSSSGSRLNSTRSGTKRLEASFGLSSGRSQGSGKNESLAYIQRIKHAYRHKHAVYEKFLVILRDFNSKSLDVVDTAHKIISLFHEKSELVLGFNEFLPDGHSIHMYQPGSFVIQYPTGGKTECVQVMVDDTISG
jgi:histone deacetylase complex regulatory component SIN3